MEWAKANSLITELAKPDRFGRTLRNSVGFDYYEIGDIVKTPAVYQDTANLNELGMPIREVVTPAVMVGGHHVDCRFSGATEDRLTQGKEQTELKTVTFEGQQVERPVLKPATDRVTLTAVEGVTTIEPVTPYHEWC